MFKEFTNQVYTPDIGIVVSDNTDTFIKGPLSKRMEWVDAENKKCIISFDEINLSDYEEITLYVLQKRVLSSNSLFSFKINGKEYYFSNASIQGEWMQILIDCSELGNTSEIEITSLVPNLVLFTNLLGYRKVGYDKDVDLLESFRQTIQLTYNVETTLMEDVSIGDTNISLASFSYIYETTMLVLDDGVKQETVSLEDMDGNLVLPLTQNFLAAETIVKAICPTLIEGINSIEPDPIVGISVSDINVDKQYLEEPVHTKYITKMFTGELGIQVYIDTRSKLKFLELVTEYKHKYGEGFYILLDGERVCVKLDTTNFFDRVIGNNPRLSFFYYVEPQPTLISRPNPKITDAVVTGESVSALDMTKVKQS